MMSLVSDVTLPWQQLFEAAPTAISVIDPFGRQVACNQAYADLLGYPIDELADLDVGSVTRASDHGWTRSYLRQLASGDVEEFVTDKVYVRKDGTEFTARLSARALRDSDGQCSLLAATIVPVEARAPIGEAAARRLLEFTTDSLTIIDPDGDVRETTGRYAPVLGYPPEFWHTRTIFDLVSDDERSRLLGLRERLTADPTTPIETEIEVRAADGSIETLQVLATNCLDDPEIGGIVVTTRNITEHLRTLSELLRSRDVAEEVADAQTRLLATVSHELRNPLHAVQGLAELLADEDLPAPTAALAETLRRQLSSLTQVTQDLLDAARLDAGAVAIEPRPTNVAALVTDVVAMASSAAAHKSVDVSSRVAVDVPDWVMIDGDRVRQVLSNLIGNAVKFTPAGTVQLVVRPSADDTINFSVVDTGVGIPAEEQAAVLEPFRVASTGGENRGAGLGLSIVQRLVGAMNGRIRMSSEVGRGTRFDLWLPVEAAAAPGSTNGSELPAGLKVLVVEDNPVNQQLARSQLERLGLVATIVGAGEDALDLLDGASDGSFDVVLMDHQLPGISGLETTRRIRERSDGLAEIPVVGLSASASAADADAFLAAGMNDFVSKPASLGDLSTAIARAVDRSSAASPDVAADGQAAAGAADLDLGVLQELVVDLGDHAVVAGLVETFLNELDGRVNSIDSATRGGDVETARRAAHTLKSSARLLGAVQLADACASIERDPAASVEVVPLAATASELMRAWLERQAAQDREEGS
jgi:PAS domain S-box-containing protein